MDDGYGNLISIIHTPFYRFEIFFVRRFLINIHVLTFNIVVTYIYLKMNNLKTSLEEIRNSLCFIVIIVVKVLYSNYHFLTTLSCIVKEVSSRSIVCYFSFVISF